MTCRCSTASTWGVCSSASRASSPTGTSSAIASGCALWEAPLATVVFVWALLWWIGGAVREIDLRATAGYANHVFVLFAAGSCVAFSLLWKALRWRLARYPALGLLLVMILIAAGRRSPSTGIRLAQLGCAGLADRVCGTPVAAAPARRGGESAMWNSCTRASSGCSPRSPPGSWPGSSIGTWRRARSGA